MILNYDGEEELYIWSIFIIELNRIATSTYIELKVRAIQAISVIFEVETGELSSRNYMIDRTKKCFKQLKNNPLKNIVYASCVVPISFIEGSGYRMFLTLAEIPWGQEEINKCSPLLDLIKDCNEDHDQIRWYKQMIIKRLSR